MVSKSRLGAAVPFVLKDGIMREDNERVTRQNLVSLLSKLDFQHLKNFVVKL